MKNLVWDDSLSVEVDEIDEDHRRLVDLFNLLGQSVEQGESSDYIEAVLEELISCTIWHFRHEERLMLQYKYVAINEHKEEHRELVESVRNLQKKFFDADKILGNADIEFLEDWLTQHILGQDMKLGFFLMREM